MYCNLWFNVSGSVENYPRGPVHATLTVYKSPIVDNCLDGPVESGFTMQMRDVTDLDGSCNDIIISLGPFLRKLENGFRRAVKTSYSRHLELGPKNIAVFDDQHDLQYIVMQFGDSMRADYLLEWRDPAPIAEDELGEPIPTSVISSTTQNELTRFLKQ